MGLSKKERRERRNERVAETRIRKRAERRDLHDAVKRYLDGEAADVVVEERDATAAKVALPDRADASGGARVDVEIEVVGPGLYRVAPDARPGMRVAVLIVSSPRLLSDLRTDPGLEQLLNLAALPGVVGPVLAMPDCHAAYGMPVGGVAAVDRTGIVSVGGIGGDINCGVRLMRTDLKVADLERRKNPLAEALYRSVLADVGTPDGVTVTREDLSEILSRGAAWAAERGYEDPGDLAAIESRGALPGADPEVVSSAAQARGLDQLGTLGAGNHFCEVQVVDEVYLPEVAAAFGLEVGRVCLCVHSGSRGLGHQVFDDYLAETKTVMERHGLTVPDRRLAGFPILSAEGQRYLGAMAAAANYAFANRQGIAARARRAFRQVFGDVGLQPIYDVGHNVAKFEEHWVGDRQVELLVHRKGATRAFPAGHPEIPEAYRHVGQPVLIPGDMGRYSFVAVGTPRAMELTFGSICHGAGRRLTRADAQRRLQGTDVAAALARQGIVVRSSDERGLAEEAPLAYKDVADVVDVCEMAGIARKVARLRPRIVIKG
jgi:tRNA-splicing ligase RtcB